MQMVSKSFWKRGVLVKKLAWIVLIAVLMLTLISCGESVSTTVDADSLGEVPENTVKTEAYTAFLSSEEWEASHDDLEGYTHFGTGLEVGQAITAKYPGRTWYVLNADGTRTKVSYTNVIKMGQIGAKVEKISEGKHEITLIEVSAKAASSWERVTARAGSYLMFEFTANLPMDYYITVTPKKAGDASTAVYEQNQITVKKTATGTYKGIAKCTVPYFKGKTYYINICMDKGDVVLDSIPVEITAAKYDSPYSLQFIGEWDLIEDPEYLPNLVDLFYNVYPRLYQRFGLGNEPKEIFFEADKDYDGVAYCSGTRVCVSVEYANKNPRNLGFFSHEITHSVQQYSALEGYGDETSYNGVKTKVWWTENMANYGGFRYFHWGYSPKFVQIYNVKTESRLWDWGWEPYGDGSKLFLSYIDFKFPTTDKNKDGKIETSEYGVIDLVNYTIKTATKSFNDNPYNPDSPFNQAVASATGGKFKTMDELRQQYAKDCQSGAWFFTGFRDYQDNFLTEGLGFVADPDYPMWETVTPGTVTNTASTQSGVKADTAVLPAGENLALGAKVVEFSAEYLPKEPIANAFDGKLDTNWRSLKDGANSMKYQLMGYPAGFVIDLGELEQFDTYVLVNSGIVKTDSFNVVSWEILISEDGKSFTSVDYQSSCAADVVTVSVGMQSARYIEFRAYKTDASNTGALRLQEFMLFKAE